MKATIKVKNLPPAPKPTLPVRVDDKPRTAVVFMEKREPPRTRGHGVSYSYWTPREKNKLIRMRDKGASTERIARSLGKTEAAVKNMVMVLIRQGVIQPKRRGKG